MISIYSKVGQNFKALRRILGISQVELADKINVSNSYISAIEKGKAKNISDQLFNSIELKYGISQNILVEGNSDDIKKALKKSNVYSDTADWGYLKKVVEIIDSDTIYSKVLLQNIDAFYQAVITGNDRRKGDRRKQDIGYNGEDRRKGERRRAG